MTHATKATNANTPEERLGGLSRNQVVEKNIPLAQYLCTSLSGNRRLCGPDADDAFQECCLAIIRAVDGFDPDCEDSNLTAYISRSIRIAFWVWYNNRSPIQVPKNFAASPRKQSEKPELTKKLRAAKRWMSFNFSKFDVGIKAKDDSDEAKDGLFVNELRAALRRLPATHREVLERRYGIGGVRETLEEIAVRQSPPLTRECIRLKELRAKGFVEDIIVEMGRRKPEVQKLTRRAA